MCASPMDCAAPAGTAPAGTDARPSRAAPAGTAPAGTDARLSLRELAEMALFLKRGGASKVEISKYDHGGVHFTAVFPAGLPAGAASGFFSAGLPAGAAPGWRGGQRPHSAQAENWRRRDAAAVPGPKAQPRRRKANVAASTAAAVPGPKAQPRRHKANVAASAPGQQEGGNAKTRRNAKRTTARRECKAAAPTTPPRTRGFCPPAKKAMRRVRTPEYSASPEGRRAGWRERDAEWDAEEAKRVAEGAEAEEERSPMVEVAPAKAQEVGAPEEIAPEAAGELGAGAHAPQEAGTPEETAPAAAGRG